MKILCNWCIRTYSNICIATRESFTINKDQCSVACLFLVVAGIRDTVGYSSHLVQPLSWKTLL